MYIETRTHLHTEFRFQSRFALLYLPYFPVTGDVRRLHLNDAKTASVTDCTSRLFVPKHCMTRISIQSTPSHSTTFTLSLPNISFLQSRSIPKVPEVSFLNFCTDSNEMMIGILSLNSSTV